MILLHRRCEDAWIDNLRKRSWCSSTNAFANFTTSASVVNGRTGISEISYGQFMSVKLDLRLPRDRVAIAPHWC
jgi:hypothetical protein